MKILYYSPDPTDASSFYRGWGALRYLPSTQVDMVPTDVSWTTFSGYDLLFVQRPYLPEHVTLIEYALQQIPVVVDYDDALFAVPAENKAYNTFKQPAVRAAVATCLELAYGVIFSTERLREHFSRNFSTPYAVIPNAHNNYIWPELQYPTAEQNIFWRGGHSHYKDLITFRDAIIKPLQAVSGWDLTCMGASPWPLEPAELTYFPPCDLLEYQRLLREEFRPAICIVPLVDNTFNRCKSNLAWVEATAAGAITLVPDWPEWEGKATTTYSDELSFQTQLTMLMSLSAQQRRDAWQAAQYHLPVLGQTNLDRTAFFQAIL